jgi:hypothetical protein
MSQELPEPLPRVLATWKNNQHFLAALDQPLVDQKLLENVDCFSMQQNRYRQLIAHLGLAMDPELGKYAVIDFTVELFQALDFVRRG